jgi:hypothetical protein
METLVNVGQNLTLNAQLSDGDLSLPKTVKAILKDPNANTVATVILAHVGQGLFLNNVTSMPEVDFLIAQYFVFNENDEIDYGYSAGLNVFRNSESIGLSGGTSGGSGASTYIVEVANDSH